MNISLKILENEKEIARRIAQSILPDVKRYLNNSINYIEKELPNIINAVIINTPEYSSILGGKLKYEFGIPDSSQKLAGLLNIWSRNIETEYFGPILSGNSQIRAKFSASMIKVDFSDVLYSDYAKVYDNIRGYELPWLQWLLLEGNKTIIKNHQIIVGPSKASRTGFAIMRKRDAASWKVPAEFAGTEADNWITRAIDKAEDQINELFKKALDL